MYAIWVGIGVVEWTKCIIGVNVYLYGFGCSIHIEGGVKQSNKKKIVSYAAYCKPRNMACTKQKIQKVPNLSKGACSIHKICTIRPKANQKNALTFQEKLAILQKMPTILYGLDTKADCISSV